LAQKNPRREFFFANGLIMRPTGGNEKEILASHARQNVHDVTVLHDVRLGFRAVDAVAFGFLYGAEAIEVGVADDLAAHEAAGEGDL
jgi:hypothetical protein